VSIPVPLPSPATWRNVPAGRLFVRQRRAPSDRDEVVTAFRDGQVTARANRRTEGFTNAIQEIGYQGVRRGDLVIHSMDGFAGAIGVSDSDGKASPVVHAYRPTDAVDARFFAYMLRTLARMGFVTSLARGIRERSTAFDSATFTSLKLPTPAPTTQRAIADYLDRETARIDALIAAKRRMVELLAEREQAELSCLVIPEDCKMAHLRYFARIQGGITVDAKRHVGPNAVTRPYLRVANVQAGRLDLSEVTQITIPAPLAMRSTLRRGDVLMTEGGDIDKLGRGTVWDGQLDGCLHQNHIFAVRPAPRYVDGRYLALVSQSAHARVYFESTGVQSTNLASTSSSKILDLPIPVLPLPVQRGIIEDWERRLEKIGRLRSAISTQIDLLQDHVHAFVTSAVIGQLDIAEAA
jgi:type I restriction enzyme S subunit